MTTRDEGAGRLPTFVVIGAMKAGTTSLHHYLAEHPDIAMARVKDGDYFLARNDDRDEAWYRSLFAESAPAVGEVSANYSKRHAFGGVPGRMHALLPDVRLIYLVRDPIERILSHYHHNRVRGRETEPLARALRPFDTSNYVLTSRYAYQLQPFLERYPRERVLVVPSARLRDDTGAALRRVFEFVGVDPTFDSPAFEERHHRSVDKAARGPLRRALHRLRRSVRPPERDGITLDPGLRAQLIDHLKPDADALRDLTGEPLADWSV